MCSKRNLEARAQAAFQLLSMEPAPGLEPCADQGVLAVFA
jgi:hypothetical protein